MTLFPGRTRPESCGQAHVPTKAVRRWFRSRFVVPPVLQVALRLHDKLAEITDLTAGKLVFSSTETWRTGYQQVLESADAKRYLSVAWSVPRTTGVEPLESGAFASTPCLSITGFTSTGF